MGTRSPWQPLPKYVLTINRLFEGLTPKEISPNQDAGQFWHDFFCLDVNRDFLVQKLNEMSKEDCLGRGKPALNFLFSNSVLYAWRTASEDVIRSRCIETLMIVIRCILDKSLAGWEVMEVFAGGVNDSDRVFMEFTAMLDNMIGDDRLAVTLRHQVLQLAVVYACSINQLSPGAYLLRHDLFPSIVLFVKAPETERFTFEAILLLSILANFHKSDAANLNPYLQRIKDTKDKEFMRKMCWAANFAADAAARAYQDISDDSIPTFAQSVGSLITSLRPDKALTSNPVDPPRELFKNQPIEAGVVLLAIFDFIHYNPTFPEVLIDLALQSNGKEQPASLPPLSSTILTLSSYILSHATSSSSPRAIAYANLALNVLLAMVEDLRIMEVFCQPSKLFIRVCRQRLPALPVPPASRAPVCALIDCCVLWLRHNLHKRLEVSSYITCIHICNRIIWFLQKGRIRLEYEWIQLWQAVFGLLAFLGSKLDLKTTGGVEMLIQESVQFLDFAICEAENFTSQPQKLHEFIYELLRSLDTLRKQSSLLQTVRLPQSPSNRRASIRSDSATRALSRLISMGEFYGKQVAAAGARSAKEAMRVVAKEIEKDGLHGIGNHRDVDDPPKRADDAIGFIRFACLDGLSLMP